MILGEVEETVNYYEIDDETYEETLKVRHTPFPTGNEKKKRTTKRRQTSFFTKPNQHAKPPQLTRLVFLFGRRRGRQSEKRSKPFLFVRGDVVILISPSLRQ